MVADKNMGKPIVKIIGVRMPSGATMWMVPTVPDEDGVMLPHTEEDWCVFKLFQTTNAAVDFIEREGFRPMICNGVNAGTNDARERFNKK